MLANYDVKEIFSKRLSGLIKENGLNVKKFAQDINIPYTTVCDWIKMKTFASIEHLPKIAKYFTVSIDFLLGYTDFE